MRTYCGYEHPDEPGRACHRPKGHTGAHREFPTSTDFHEDVMQIDNSDAQKILDTLAQNEEYHIKRDEMNAAIHRAENTRYSPITSETIAQRERLQKLMQEQGVPM